MKSYYAVEVTQNSQPQISRYFETIKAARKWAKQCAQKPYFSQVRIMKDGAGGLEVR